MEGDNCLIYEAAEAGFARRTANEISSCNSERCTDSSATDDFGEIDKQPTLAPCIYTEQVPYTSSTSTSGDTIDAASAPASASSIVGRGFEVTSFAPGAADKSLLRVRQQISLQSLADYSRSLGISEYVFEVAAAKLPAGAKAACCRGERLPEQVFDGEGAVVGATTAAPVAASAEKSSIAEACNRSCAPPVPDQCHFSSSNAGAEQGTAGAVSPTPGHADRLYGSFKVLYEDFQVYESSNFPCACQAQRRNCAFCTSSTSSISSSGDSLLGESSVSTITCRRRLSGSISASVAAERCRRPKIQPCSFGCWCRVFGNEQPLRLPFLVLPQDLLQEEHCRQQRETGVHYISSSFRLIQPCNSSRQVDEKCSATVITPNTDAGARRLPSASIHENGAADDGSGSGSSRTLFEKAEKGDAATRLTALQCPSASATSDTKRVLSCPFSSLDVLNIESFVRSLAICSAAYKQLVLKETVTPDTVRTLSEPSSQLFSEVSTCSSGFRVSSNCESSSGRRNGSSVHRSTRQLFSGFCPAETLVDAAATPTVVTDKPKEQPVSKSCLDSPFVGALGDTEKMCWAAAASRLAAAAEAAVADFPVADAAAAAATPASGRSCEGSVSNGSNTSEKAASNPLLDSAAEHQQRPNQEQQRRSNRQLSDKCRNSAASAHTDLSLFVLGDWSSVFRAHFCVREGVQGVTVVPTESTTTDPLSPSYPNEATTTCATPSAFGATPVSASPTDFFGSSIGPALADDLNSEQHSGPSVRDILKQTRAAMHAFIQRQLPFLSAETVPLSVFLEQQKLQHLQQVTQEPDSSKGKDYWGMLGAKIPPTVFQPTAQAIVNIMEAKAALDREKLPSAVNDNGKVIEGSACLEKHTQHVETQERSNPVVSEEVLGKKQSPTSESKVFQHSSAAKCTFVPFASLAACCAAQYRALQEFRQQLLLSIEQEQQQQQQTPGHHQHRQHFHEPPRQQPLLQQPLLQQPLLEQLSLEQPHQAQLQQNPGERVLARWSAVLEEAMQLLVNGQQELLLLRLTPKPACLRFLFPIPPELNQLEGERCCSGSPSVCDKHTAGACAAAEAVREHHLSDPIFQQSLCVQRPAQAREIGVREQSIVESLGEDSLKHSERQQQRQQQLEEQSPSNLKKPPNWQLEREANSGEVNSSLIYGEHKQLLDAADDRSAPALTGAAAADRVRDLLSSHFPLWRKGRGTRRMRKGATDSHCAAASTIAEARISGGWSGDNSLQQLLLPQAVPRWPLPTRGNEYLHFVLFKINRDTAEVLQCLEKQLYLLQRSGSCSSNHLFCQGGTARRHTLRVAGTKDRRGITIQRCSAMKGVRPEALLNACMLKQQRQQLPLGNKASSICSNGSLVLAPLGYFPYPQHLGSLTGNFFQVIIRNLRPAIAAAVPSAAAPVKETAVAGTVRTTRATIDRMATACASAAHAHVSSVQSQLKKTNAQRISFSTLSLPLSACEPEVQQLAATVEANLQSVCSRGFLNYFGLQRFGTHAVPTYAVGAALLRGDWKHAVASILGFKGKSESSAAVSTEAHSTTAALEATNCAADTSALADIHANAADAAVDVGVEVASGLSGSEAAPETGRRAVTDTGTVPANDRVKVPGCQRAKYYCADGKVLCSLWEMLQQTGDPSLVLMAAAKHQHIERVVLSSLASSVRQRRKAVKAVHCSTASKGHASLVAVSDAFHLHSKTKRFKPSDMPLQRQASARAEGKHQLLQQLQVQQEQLQQGGREQEEQPQENVKSGTLRNLFARPCSAVQGTEGDLACSSQQCSVSVCVKGKYAGDFAAAATAHEDPPAPGLGEKRAAGESVPSAFAEENAKKDVAQLAEEDYFRALQEISPSSLQLYVHSAQSLLFNFVCSWRWRTYGSRVRVGDFVKICRADAAAKVSRRSNSNNCPPFSGSSNNSSSDLDSIQQNENVTTVCVADEEGRYISMEDVSESACNSGNGYHDDVNDLPSEVHLITSEEEARAASLYDVVLPLAGTNVALPSDLSAVYNAYAKKLLGVSLDNFAQISSAATPISKNESKRRFSERQRLLLRPSKDVGSATASVVSPANKQRPENICMTRRQKLEGWGRVVDISSDENTTGGIESEGRRINMHKSSTYHAPVGLFFGFPCRGGFRPMLVKAKHCAWQLLRLGDDVPEVPQRLLLSDLDLLLYARQRQDARQTIQYQTVQQHIHEQQQTFQLQQSSRERPPVQKDQQQFEKRLTDEVQSLHDVLVAWDDELDHTTVRCLNPRRYSPHKILDSTGSLIVESDYDRCKYISGIGTEKSILDKGEAGVRQPLLNGHIVERACKTTLTMQDGRSNFALLLRIWLPAGCYFTMALREFMRTHAPDEDGAAAAGARECY